MLEQVSKAVEAGQCDKLTEKPELDSFLLRIRFILSRFARPISLYEAMLVKYMNLKQTEAIDSQ